MELAGFAQDAAPAVIEGRVAMKPSHTVAGNPDRMAAGVLEVRPDDAWQAESGRMTNAVVTSLCFPLMRRYGYRLRAP
jgi:hypothetical protein